MLFADTAAPAMPAGARDRSAATGAGPATTGDALPGHPPATVRSGPALQRPFASVPLAAAGFPPADAMVA